MFRKTIGVAAAIALTLSACGGSGEGTLNPVIEPGGEINGFGEFSLGPTKSFGIFVCTEEGSVELQSIEPIAKEGDVEFLGAMVYTSPDMFVGAAHGYPTDGLDDARLEPLEGAVVENDCSGPEGEDRIQLIVGAERTSHLGGSIEGLLVHTSSGEVTIDYTILLCGDNFEFCDVLTEGTPAP